MHHTNINTYTHKVNEVLFNFISVRGIKDCNGYRNAVFTTDLDRVY